VINFFYPINIYALIISLCNLSKKENVIFLSKKHFYNIFNLTEFIAKRLNVKFLFIDNVNNIEDIILKNIKIKKKNIINFFHKIDDKNKFIRLAEKNINYIFLEHGLGNYYNFVNQNSVSLLKNYLFSHSIKKFKFYTGFYALLKKNIYIGGCKVDTIRPRKINSILNILKNFYKKNKDIKKFLREISLKKDIILVNVPEILTNADFNIFIDKLLFLGESETIFFFKFHAFDNKSAKRINYIKMIFKKNSFFIFNEKFNQIPLELLISYSIKCKLYSTISNVPFITSIIFKNPVYIYLPNLIKKEYFMYNELKKESYNFYKRNFSRIKFI
jgi:hypothetical protein